MNFLIERIETQEPKGNWRPKIGPFTREFIERKLSQRNAPDKDAMDRVVSEAAAILGGCISPKSSDGQDAGLVVGYVQSGKTLSFTTVIALARDNGYGVAILLAGTAVALKGQSEDRLSIDLGMGEIQHDWRKFENPELKNSDAKEIDKVLRSWRNSRGAALTKRSILITVLKQHQRLKNLRDVLAKVDLSGVPVLIIDDESDQAGLNAKAASNSKNGTTELSTTYARILDIRAVVPHHTYLQYTATPQANLLMAVADVLSPSFAELVSPGDGYLGGRDFFGGEKRLCLEIPDDDIPDADNPLREAPASLQHAFRLFLLGAAHHLAGRGKGNRSMMVHPSQRTGPHADYKEWLDGLQNHWGKFLELPSEHPARKELQDSFRESYAELLCTSPELTTFDQLIELLPEVFVELKIVKVNSNADGQRAVKWNDWPYWVLVGGQKLDRGFTVEGLTVTYMPRPLSANADTLQQRARFFGYKQSYEGLCRVFLQRDVILAFESYVESEEFVRGALKDHRGKPLQSWKRDFILNRALSPTRKSVIGRSVKPVPLDGGWMVPRAMHANSEAVRVNKQKFEATADAWRTKFGFRDASERLEFKDVRHDSPRNLLIEGVPLPDVISFLLDLRVSSLDDSTEVSATEISLVRYLERVDSKALADVVLIGELTTTGLTGRSLTPEGKINNLFVGKSPKGATSLDDLNYVGDRALHTEGRVTLHLRYLKLRPVDGIGDEVAECVPWFAIYLPDQIAKDCIIEEF